MTANTDAANRLAYELGMPAGLVLQIAKALRGAGGDLWPSGGHGGGRAAAHVKVHHLRNLLIACLGSSLVKDAPETVRTYSALPALMLLDLSSLERRPRDLQAIPFPMLANEELAGLTLGGAIDLLITAHSDPNCHLKLLELPVQIELSRSNPVARIVVMGRGKKKRGGRVVALFRDTLSVATAARVPSQLTVEAKVRETVCAACAEMIADTQWRERR